MVAVEHELPIEAPPEADSPFVRVMKIWGRWMTLADRQTPGGWAHPQDVKDFMRCSEAVDVMINDLPRIQQWAIRKAAGIAPRAPFDTESLEVALLQANATLETKMRINIATRLYFC